MNFKKSLFILFSISLSAMGQVTDVITAEHLAGTTTEFKCFSNQKFTSDVVYSGITQLGENNTILLNKGTKFQTPRIVTTASNRRIKSIAFQWNKASTNSSTSVINLYGEYHPYLDCSKKFNGTKGHSIGYIKNGTNSTIDLSEYKYSNIGIFAEEAYVYLDKITITWGKLIQNLNFSKLQYAATLGEPFESPILESATPITYSSSNTNIATVDKNTGKVTLIRPGETTITATSEETNDYDKETAEYKLNVNSVTIKKTFDFTLPKDFGFTQNGDKWDIDITQSLTQDLNDIVVTATAPTGYRQPRFYTNKNNKTGLRIYSGGTVTFSVPKGLKLNVKLTQENNKNPETIFNDNSISYSYAKDAIDANSEMCIMFANTDYTGTYELSIGPSGYATWSSQRAYILPEGLQGGIVTINSENNIASVDYCIQPGDIVAPRTALLIKGAPGTYSLIPTQQKGKSFSDTENLLRPAITADAIDAPQGKQLFIFSRRNQHLGFYWQKGSTCGDCVRNIPNKAYLEVPHCSASNSQGFRLDLDGITGIEPSPMQEKSESRIYSLTGTRVQLPINKLPKGIYIINGKKFFISK